MKHLTEIEVVTHCVADLDREVDAWQRCLGYELAERGQLGEDLCAAWDTPADAGRDYALVQPASGIGERLMNSLRRVELDFAVWRSSV